MREIINSDIVRMRDKGFYGFVWKEIKKMTQLIIWLLFIELFIYNLLDAWHTKLIFSMGGYEVNPIMRWVIDETGTVNSVFALKLILFLILGLFLGKYHSSFK